MKGKQNSDADDTQDNGEDDKEGGGKEAKDENRQMNRRRQWTDLALHSTKASYKVLCKFCSLAVLRPHLPVHTRIYQRHKSKYKIYI